MQTSASHFGTRSNTITCELVRHTNSWLLSPNTGDQSLWGNLLLQMLQGINKHRI